jgi:hypothetical protein
MIIINLKNKMECLHKQDFESTFYKYKNFYIVSQLWNSFSSIIDVTIITELSNTVFDTLEEPIWFTFYKLYILNRNLKIKVTKEFVNRLKDYLEGVTTKYISYPVNIISITNKTVFEYHFTKKDLLTILI